MNTQIDNRTTSATDTYLVGSATSVFSISGLHLRLLPVLATVGLGLMVILPSGYVFVLLTKRMAMQSSMATPWLAMLANHAVMLAIALALIAWFSKGNLAEYGLQWPRHLHYVPSALLCGAAFGLLMTVVDYFPQILKHIPPPENLSLAPASVGAWLFFQGIYVGPTEEIPFRCCKHISCNALRVACVCGITTCTSPESFWHYCSPSLTSPAFGRRTCDWHWASRYMLSPLASSMRTGAKNPGVYWRLFSDTT